MKNSITITIHYNEVIAFSENNKTVDFPMSCNTLLIADYYRNNGWTAELNGTMLTVRHSCGLTKQFAVSYELSGLDCSKNRNYNKVFATINNIVYERLHRTVRYINHKAW